jgi:hypothetical protein
VGDVLRIDRADALELDLLGPQILERPSPTRTGTRWICISSMSPAFRYCWIAFAPPAIETSLSPAAAFA